MTEETMFISLRIPASLDTKLRLLAALSHLDRSKIIRQALEEYSGHHLQEVTDKVTELKPQPQP